VTKANGTIVTSQRANHRREKQKLAEEAIVECSALQYMHKNNFRGGFIVTSWIIYKIEAYVLRFQNPKAVKKRPVPNDIKIKKLVRYMIIKKNKW
jgi:hypothetical protein